MVLLNGMKEGLSVHYLQYGKEMMSLNLRRIMVVVWIFRKQIVTTRYGVVKRKGRSQLRPLLFT